MHDKSTQINKVEELAAMTTYLQFVGNETAPSSPLRSGGDRVPVLLHCEWSPVDPTLLAAAGTDAFARVWTIAKAPAAVPPAVGGADAGVVAAATGPGQDAAAAAAAAAAQPPFSDIMPVSAHESAYVTALAWNGDGASIAVATVNDDEAAISIFSSSGEFMHQLQLEEPPILKMRWNPNNVGLLAIAPADEGASVTIFAPSGRLQYMLPHVNSQDQSELDAVWMSETDFLLCAGEMLAALRCAPAGVELLRKYEVESGDRFAQIQYDAHSRLAATPTLGGGLVVGILRLYRVDAC
jgi:WD40 repeat protein